MEYLNSFKKQPNDLEKGNSIFTWQTFAKGLLTITAGTFSSMSRINGDIELAPRGEESSDQVQMNVTR